MRAAKPARRIEPQLISPSQAARAAQAFAAATTSGVAAAPKGPAPALQQLSLREQAAYSDAHPEVTRRFYVELTSECTEVNWKKVRALQPRRARSRSKLCRSWTAYVWHHVNAGAPGAGPTEYLGEDKATARRSKACSVYLSAYICTSS